MCHNIVIDGYNCSNLTIRRKLLSDAYNENSRIKTKFEDVPQIPVVNESICSSVNSVVHQE